MIRFGNYQVKRGDNLADPGFWNPRLQDVDARLAAREADADNIQRAINSLISVGLSRLNDTFTPLLTEAAAQLANFGVRFSTTSASSVSIPGVGDLPVERSFVLPEDDRARWVFVDFVSIRSVADSTKGMIGRVLSYERAAGLLTISVIVVDGSGTFDNWIVSLSPEPDLTTAAQITAAIDALINSAPGTLDTLKELADALGDDANYATTTATALGYRLKFDAAQSLSSGQKTQARDNLGLLDYLARFDAAQSLSSAQQTQLLTNLGIQSGFSDRFRKLDPASVGFTKTGAGTISIKAGTVIELAGLLYSFASATAVQMPSLSAGTDYAIYMCNDGTVRADANFSAPTGFSTSTSRQIGGFHCAPGGNATGTSGGDTTPAINTYSIWDLKWRPACADPRGMALVAGRFWSDIYLCGVDHYANGTSRYNVTIADGSSPPKIAAAFGGNGSTAYGQFNWWDASEVMQSAGKDLLSYAEFCAAGYGTTEGTQSGADPVSTILTAAFTSKWGLMLVSGNMWQWGKELGGPYSAASWTSDPASRGQYYELPNAVIFGGPWVNGALCGSRAADWDLTPANSVNLIGARGRCDHLHHV